MKKFLFALVFTLLFADQSFATSSSTATATPDIPDGVVYKPASPKVNSIAEEALINAFSDNDLNPVLSDSVFVGPALWRSIESLDLDFMRDLEVTPVNFKLPYKDKSGKQQFTELKGALFKEDKSRKALARFLKGILASSPSRIRAPKSHELSAYWSIISFDIEEPIFVLQVGDGNKSINLLVDMTGDKIFWVEEISRYGRR